MSSRLLALICLAGLALSGTCLTIVAAGPELVLLRSSITAARAYVPCGTVIRFLTCPEDWGPPARLRFLWYHFVILLQRRWAELAIWPTCPLRTVSAASMKPDLVRGLMVWLVAVLAPSTFDSLPWTS